MRPQHIRLFIKPFCGWCDEATDWLEEHGLAFESLDVMENAVARREMFRLTGQTLAPVIDVDGRILADFGVDELEAWWKQQGFE